LVGRGRGLRQSQTVATPNLVLADRSGARCHRCRCRSAGRPGQQPGRAGSPTASMAVRPKNSPRNCRIVLRAGESERPRRGSAAPHRGHRDVPGHRKRSQRPPRPSPHRHLARHPSASRPASGSTAASIRGQGQPANPRVSVGGQVDEQRAVGRGSSARVQRRPPAWTPQSSAVHESSGHCGKFAPNAPRQLSCR
jgi:hypothetical protein